MLYTLTCQSKLEKRRLRQCKRQLGEWSCEERERGKGKCGVPAVYALTNDEAPSVPQAASRAIFHTQDEGFNISFIFIRLPTLCIWESSNTSHLSSTYFILFESTIPVRNTQACPSVPTRPPSINHVFLSMVLGPKEFLRANIKYSAKISIVQGIICRKTIKTFLPRNYRPLDERLGGICDVNNKRNRHPSL
jgi:hypothetical protein